MLRSVSEMNGYKIIALDGEIGSVEDFYFDDEKWALRYVIVKTGTWLEQRQVLISPYSVQRAERELKQLHVFLTKAQIDQSPLIDTHKPVSRQMEAAHLDFYGYPYYWDSNLLWGEYASPVMPTTGAQTAEITGTEKLNESLNEASDNPNGATVTARVMSEDVHLRSAQEVANYSIATTDGEFGGVEDFIVEDETWAIRYLAINTHKWLPGKKVIIAPQWISSIDWAKANVNVLLSREGIEKSPTYDSTDLLSREYEEQLHVHYGQKGYWQS